MARPPAKWDGEGRLLDQSQKKFAGISDKSLQWKSAPQDNDRIETLVELPSIMKNVGEMERSHLLSSRLERLPWSDSYWPTYLGMLGVRYGDPGFPKSTDWLVNYNYVQSAPASAIYAGGAADAMDNLAPSEKYDFLIGDSVNTLTNSLWEVGRYKYEKYKEVASWEGICDGWSAASVKVDEPIHAVSVVGASGRPVRFFPSDIKALASLLWSRGASESKFVGTICPVRNPEKDRLGRIVDPQCINNNAGTFHMALVNQLGIAKSSFIMDATYDLEIWNYPVFMYQYSYFNPQTLQPVKSYSDGLIPVDEFYIDKFKAYRAPGTKFVMGVVMDVSYMVEIEPNHSEGHHASPHVVRYIYDLELDQNLGIIGGEWYSSMHPDFMWRPTNQARALSAGDLHLLERASEWNGNNPIPADWVGPARQSSRLRQPLAVVVERLVELSRER